MLQRNINGHSASASQRTITAMPNAQFAADSEDQLLWVAATAHLARNLEAVSDSILAALLSARDVNAHIICSSAATFSHQISSATALTAARSPSDLLSAQQEYGRRVLRAYAMSARILPTLLAAGAKATKEPLLERLG